MCIIFRRRHRFGTRPHFWRLKAAWRFASRRSPKRSPVVHGSNSRPILGVFASHEPSSQPVENQPNDGIGFMGREQVRKEHGTFHEAPTCQRKCGLRWQSAAATSTLYTFSDRQELNPKGIPKQSPGLRGTSNPGKSSDNHNPNGVVAHSQTNTELPQPRCG